MISYDEALCIIREIACLKSMECENINLPEIENRVLVSDIISTENSPSFDNSAMDGFAVCAGETKANARLKVNSSAVEIMTGAPMPRDRAYDCVVRIEDCTKISQGSQGTDEYIEICRPLKSGENVRYAGSDIKKGECVVKAKTVLSASHIMALASIGKTSLNVYRKPRVALVSTGNELVDISTRELTYGKIRNSSLPYLTHVLQIMGCEVTSYGIMQDDAGEFRSFIDKIKGSHDFVISTGAMSMGKFDFVHDVLCSLGAQIYFHKVAIRPGKPILFARLTSGCVYFGLPGNPMASAVGLRFFIVPYMQALFGLPPEAAIFAVNAENKVKPEGLTCFFRASLAVDEQAVLRVNIHQQQASNAVKPQILTNAWAVLAQAGGKVLAGEIIRVVRE